MPLAGIDPRERGASPALLVAVALGAAAVNQLFWLLPLALMLGLPALWFGNVWLSGLALAAFVLMAWLLQPRAAHPPRELRADEAPGLFARVHALADALQAPRVHAIAVDDDLNAGALELNRGISLRPVRRVLILGRPLLAALDVAAAEAVIAHELGHFSRRHGRLGHWLYNTRKSWAALGDGDATIAADSSAWERAAAHFAQWFLPWFDQLSLPCLRRCEFEADELAAQVADSQALARALTVLARLHDAQSRVGDAAVRQLMRAQPERPDDLIRRELAAWRASATGAAALPPEEPPHGTHPPLAQRLAALGVTASADAWPADSAGAAWFGSRWPAVLSQPAGDEARLAWRLAHRLLCGVVQERALLDVGAPTEQHLHLALVLGEPLPPGLRGGDGPAEQLLRAQHALQTGARDAARALLEACRAYKTLERDEATALLVAHGMGRSEEERGRHAAWLRHVLARRAMAAAAMTAAVAHGSITEAPLSAAAHGALATTWHAHPAVREAWVYGQRAVVQQVDYVGARLLLRVDPHQLTRLQLDEDRMLTLASDLLRWVAPPAALVHVRIRYTTEGLPPALAGALASRPGARLL